MTDWRLLPLCKTYVKETTDEFRRVRRIRDRIQIRKVDGRATKLFVYKYGWSRVFICSFFQARYPTFTRCFTLFEFITVTALVAQFEDNESNESGPLLSTGWPREAAPSG